LGYRNLILGLEGRLAVPTVKRPEVRNALDAETVEELAAGLVSEVGET